jgi:SAM-dependent methyltransferase
MSQALYHDLVSWYDLLDPVTDHVDEAACFAAAFTRALSAPPRSLLELGAGAGHTALHLKAHFACTLVEPSAAMAARSRALNPECTHVLGDMRDVRLSQQFDAVLIHDAIMYMTTEADLAAAVRTAYVHTRPGGAAIIAPDCVRDDFEEHTRLESGRDGTRTLQCLMWDWDPDPADDSFVTEFVLTMRDGGDVKVAHDRHVQGVFSRATWARVLSDAGFEVTLFPRPIGEDAYDQAYLARRPL